MIDKVENYCIFRRGKEKDGRYKNNNGQNEIKVIVTRTFEMVSYVKGYHVYKTSWNPLIGEFL